VFLHAESATATAKPKTVGETLREHLDDFQMMRTGEQGSRVRRCYALVRVETERHLPTRIEERAELVDEVLLPEALTFGAARLQSGPGHVARVGQRAPENEEGSIGTPRLVEKALTPLLLWACL